MGVGKITTFRALSLFKKKILFIKKVSTFTKHG